LQERMVFFNVGWMKKYQGITGDDAIQGGGKYVSKNKFGHEIYNFADHNGRYYGYVQPSPGNTINIDRLGAHPSDEWIDDVLVVWVSTAPEGGSVIVGWYENARIYRYYQDAPRGSKRIYKGERCGYYCTADATNCVLLPVDSRTFSIPRRHKGGMGQSNVWYADKDEHRHIREEVVRYIRNYKNKKPSNDVVRTTFPQRGTTNPFRRQEIERAAVIRTIEYYERLGYTVTSVEKDHVGWDLEARQGKRLLLLEVKGLSGQSVAFDLTPNEFDKMNSNKDIYRICVLTGALSDTERLHIFSYSPDTGAWESDTGERLNIAPLTGARIRV
jgi:hypothetical protein